MKPLESIVHSIEAHQPRKLFWRRWVNRAAVSAVLSTRDNPSGPSVLLMKRATREGDPWSGHMSFPGGRRESDDAHVYATAVRETYEEIGLDVEAHGAYVGRLSDVVARPIRWKRLPFVITPFVFQLEQEPAWQLDPMEVQELVWVPLRFLADYDNREQMEWQRGKLKVTLPCYWYAGYRIWGLTLRMLDELVDVVTA